MSTYTTVSENASTEQPETACTRFINILYLSFYLSLTVLNPFTRLSNNDCMLVIILQELIRI